MTNLEQLVPPFELCRKIPADAFNNTVFAWKTSYLEVYVTVRNRTTDQPIIPAPTAQEMYNAEKDKVIHLRTLRNQICCLLAHEKNTVVTLDFVLTYIDEIIDDTKNLLAKARGKVKG